MRRRLPERMNSRGSLGRPGFTRSAPWAPPGRTINSVGVWATVLQHVEYPARTKSQGKAAPRPTRGLPPDGGVQVLYLVDRLRVDAGGEVLPAVVGDQEDDVAALELLGDAHGDARDRAGGDAGEDA